MTDTFYEILGVPADASTAAIEAAYRERLKETHPDVSDAADAGEATQRLIEARDVLTDEAERARYDRLGHQAYVAGESDSAADDGSSDVAAAARRAGYGTQGSADDNADGREANGTDSNRRHTARERARRERAASERVAADRRQTSSANTSDSGPADTSSGVTDEPEETATATESSDSWDPGTTATSGFSGSGGGGTAWSSSATYTVRQTETVTGGSFLEMPTGRELTLFVITFALYPVMLFSALLPAFPLWVNATIGFCTLLLVGYLQSEPTIAIMVFGSWSLTTAVLLVTLQVSPFSLLGLLALSGTWLPFGFSLLTASVMRL